MKNNVRNLIILVICFLLGSSTAVWADELTVLPEKIDGVSPGDMMKKYLNDKASVLLENWKVEYEKLKTAEEISRYQKRMRELFIESIGGLPQRTPLNAEVVGEIKRSGYRIEKVLFESQPNHHIAALMFLPESKEFKPPYPVVFFPCGHSRNGKAYKDYQKACALMALNGLAVLTYDPIDQGERIYTSQLFESYSNWNPVTGHTMVGVGSILLGRNAARFEVHNSIRALDYLQSRDDIDGERIGCAGNSGGGTSTAYLMAIDERVKAAAPSCYLTNWETLLAKSGPQDAEHNIFGQLANGMVYADYVMMAAPRAVLMCCSTKDYYDITGAWETLRYGNRLYSRMGYADNLNLHEHDDRHGYFQPVRETTTRWMTRWLRGKDERVIEPEIEVLTDEEIVCSPGGMVMNIKGERSTYDLNRDYEKQLAKQRSNLWTTRPREEMLNKVRELCGIRRIEELPEPVIEHLGTIERPGYSIKKLIIKPEKGIYLPALMFVPEGISSKGTVLYINEDGKAADANEDGPIERLTADGKVVLAVDIRGIGETMRTGRSWTSRHFGANGQDFFRAYLMGKSFVGMRAEDILVCGRFLQKQSNSAVDMVAVGNVAVPALHAAALEPEFFDSVKLTRTLVNWWNIIQSDLSQHQLVNTVHGALTVYDFDHLRKVIAEKISLIQPVNARGQRID
ncbi:MAG: alpha/beta hydrolase family protein [Planctomycetota bacterium]|jgi:dienelactone hydrolase